MNEETKNSTGIKGFLDENKDYFVSVGILGALISLFTNLSVQWLGYLLSFLMAAALALVWSEIKFTISKTDSLKLIFLKWFFKISFWLIVFYIPLKFRIISWLFLFIPLSIFFLFLLIKIFNRFDAMINFFRSENIIKKILSFIIIILFVLLSMSLAHIVSGPLNWTFDQIDHWNSQIHLY